MPSLPGHVERRHLALAGAGCVALAAVALVEPGRLPFTPCPLRAMTGLDCPLCGATRATHALVHGDLLAALDLNALFVVTAPIVVLVMLVWFVRGRLPGVLRKPVASWALLAVAVAFAVVRNLPIEPFEVLGTAVGRQ